MIKMTGILYFLFAGLMIWLASSAASATADCYSDCMDADGCGIAGFNTDASSCSGTQVRCSTDCRDQAPQKSYGAIAYSSQDGAYGYSDGWDNQGKAEKTALRYCSQNGSGCEIQVWFQNSCGAVAADGNLAFWGQNDSEEEAKRLALENCMKSGGQNCEVKVSHCSR